MSTISTTSISIDGLSGILAIPWLVTGFFLVNLIVIFLLAVAVKNDAEMQSAKKGLFLVGPWFWFFIVLFTGGYLPTFAYWIIHYSSLRDRKTS